MEFPATQPFGDAIPIPLEYYPEQLALWQAFGQHTGHTVANRLFGTNQTGFELQGKLWTSTSVASGSNIYLEGFDPNITLPAEKFNWIPVGLITDLIDPIGEVNPIGDNVSGFTYLEIQSAFQTKPASLADFKNALKQIRPAQSIALDLLFSEYGY